MFNTSSYTRLPAHNWQTAPLYQSYAMAFLVGAGFRPTSAAAICGNLMQESAFNPDATRKNDAGQGEDSVGIGQWNKTRLSALKAFMDAGIDRADSAPWRLYTQLVFMVHELATTEQKAMTILREDETQPVSDPGLAGKFGMAYEGFSDASVPIRNAYAKVILFDYQNDKNDWS